MKKETLLKLISKALDIQPSSRHSVTLDIYKDKSLTIYIHCTLETNTFVTDSKSISSQDGYPQFNKWLTGWTAIIETEREEDEANRS